MKGNLLIRGGRVLDPGTGRDEKADVLIENGVVAAVGQGLKENGAEVLDATGLVVCPGFVDIHVHLREPGQEYKETIETGTAAAVAGGFTAVCCMPNTQPVNDEAAVTEHIIDRTREKGSCRVYPVGAVSRGLKGEELAEMAEMRRAGAVAFSDDGKPVWNSAVLRRAMEYSRVLEAPILQHAEDHHLGKGGVMNEGLLATRLGLAGVPSEGEAAVVARDILLVELTGARYHVQHLSVARALEEVRRAKEKGLPVTCEVAPHHMVLTEEACEEYDTNTKMNPPLRTMEDAELLVEGCADGTVDAIATDHAPHVPVEKEVPFDEAPFGVIGLETAIPVIHDRLVRPGRISLQRMVELFTTGPRKALGLPGGTLAEGEPGDATLLDLERQIVIDPAKFRSRSRNCPFAGWELTGAAAATVVGGLVRYRA